MKTIGTRESRHDEQGARARVEAGRVHPELGHHSSVCENHADQAFPLAFLPYEVEMSTVVNLG